MEDLIFIIQIFLLGFMLVYFVVLSGWSMIFNRYQSISLNPVTQSVTSVSVIVAVRNEKDKIERCIENLQKQIFTDGNLEIIISDDFSTDATVAKIKSFLAVNSDLPFPVRVVVGNDGHQAGKKNALDRAIKIAKGEFMITTDADCSMANEWVSSHVNLFRQTGAAMVIGFVKITPGNNFFQKLQALELLSLSLTGAVSVIRDKPLMCNGANLSFTKKAFREAGGYDYGKDNPSGDDTFLMLKLAGINDMRIVFNSSEESIVSTEPQIDLKSLISQRTRWASKMKNYKEAYILRTGFLMFLINLILLLTPVLALVKLVSWFIAGTCWLIKVVADLIFIIPATRFTHQEKLLWLFLPLQLIYPLYLVIGAFISVFSSRYRWKGRTY